MTQGLALEIKEKEVARNFNRRLVATKADCRSVIQSASIKAQKRMKTLLSKVIIETKDEQNIQKTFYGEDARDKAIDYAKQIKNPETVWIETVEKI